MTTRQTTRQGICQTTRCVSHGSGITAGLDLWFVASPSKNAFVLVDQTPDARFAVDVDLWNSNTGLNPEAYKYLRNAIAEQDTAQARPVDTRTGDGSRPV